LVNWNAIGTNVLNFIRDNPGKIVIAMVLIVFIVWFSGFRIGEDP
jgi:hypothetical protein